MSGTTTIYASFRRRLSAYITDSSIMAIPVSIIGFALNRYVISLAVTGLEAEAFAAGAKALNFIAALIIAWLYFAIMESSAKQGTIGKMAFDIKVTDYNGGKISFGKASVRFFGKILSGILFFIGYLMVGFTKKKQGLHDKMAGTLCLLKNQSNETNPIENPINKESGYQKPVETISTTIELIKDDNGYPGNATPQHMPPPLISNNGKPNIKTKNELQENEKNLYERIWKEIEENKTDVGLWAECFAACDGDENKTRAMYLNKRIADIKEALRQQSLDRKREAEKKLKQDEAGKLSTPEGESENIEIFKNKLNKDPDFFHEILGEYGYRLVQNEDRPEMWSILFPNGIGARHVYNLYDLRSEINKIVSKQES